MKKKTSSRPIFFYSSLLIIVFVACSLIQTGCGNAGGQTTQQKSSDNWITMNITFKPNTDEEFREKAIMAYRKNVDQRSCSVYEKDANLYPSIRVIKFPFLDTLKYRVSLLSTSYSISDSGEPKPLTTYMAVTPCPPCPGLCPYNVTVLKVA